MPLVHIASILLGSFLLFLVQPLAGRMFLPGFGGSPAVWTTTLVFFQVLLLGGYLYAHLLVRLRGGLAVGVHLAVLVLPLLLLPPSAPAAMDPSTAAWPAATLLLALAATVGAPFLVLASNSSLVQFWWAAGGRAGERDPYWLYAASNLGSLVALLVYPFVLEPGWDLPGQTRLWSGGYAIFALGTAGVAILSLRRGGGAGPKEPLVAEPVVAEPGAPEIRTGGAPEPVTGATPPGTPGAPLSPLPPSGRRPGGATAPPSPGRQVGWVLRSAVGSALLIALTTRITTDATPLPFLWVAPLAAYLITWIVAFAVPDRLRRTSLAGSATLGVVGSLVLLALPVQVPLSALVAISLWTLFFGALLCHRDLAVDRPDPSHLTAFYLLIAVGGALGGVMNSLLAPVLFNSLAEVPLTLMALTLLFHADPGTPSGWTLRPLPPRTGFAALMVAAILLVAVVGRTPLVWGVALAAVAAGGILIRRFPPLMAAGIILLGGAWLASGPVTLIAQERSFFGVIRVRVVGEEIRMLHGSTVHGGQSINPLLRRVPRSYYHPSGPMGGAVLAARDGARIGVVGLGTGALAVLTRPGQEIVFHEIDPIVEPLARSHFTFLEDAPAEVRVELGDGRLTLGREAAAGYDLLIVDAFTSGNVPVHLLTVEALELFRSRLRPGGLLLLHISNRHADLRRVVRGYAEQAGVAVAIASHSPSPQALAEGADPSVVAALPAPGEPLPSLPEGHAWPVVHPGVPPILWTDHRSDLLGAVRGR